MTDPTPDEAAARLADAETYTRAMAERRKHHGALAAFVAEYDRRGEEIAALRAEVERARDREQAVRDLCENATSNPALPHPFADKVLDALSPVETPQEENR